MADFTFDPHGNRSGRRRLAYATLLIMVILAIDILSGGAVRAVLQRAASGLWDATGYIRSNIIGSGIFSTRSSLARANESLEKQVDSYTQKAAAYDSLMQENEILRSLLNLTRDTDGITAPIVSSVRSSPYGTFIVRAGERNGISAGDLVVTEGGFVAGVITEVGPSTSVVREVFAGGEKVDSHIGGAAAVSNGRGGGNAIAEIPRGVDVQIGSAVTAPEFGGRPIGVVGNIEADSSSASQTVYLNLPVNLGSLKYIYIVKSN